MRERKRKNFSQGYKSNLFMGKTSTILVGLGLLFMFGVLYISGTNTLAAKSDTMADLQTKKDQLTVQKQRLQIEASRLQSLQEIQKSQSDSSAASKLVPTQKINYLPTSSVATR